MLGIITDRSPTVILWDANSHKTSRLDTGVRDVLTLLIWSKNLPLLAVGTSKGNLLIYDHDSQRKIPILGKHTKKIGAGAWSEQNLLALVGDDKTLTISNKDGDTITQTSLKGASMSRQTLLIALFYSACASCFDLQATACYRALLC